MRFSSEGDPLAQAAAVVEQVREFVRHCRGRSEPAGAFMRCVTERTLGVWKTRISVVLSQFPESVISDDSTSCVAEESTWHTAIDERNYPALERLLRQLDERLQAALAVRSRDRAGVNQAHALAVAAAKMPRAAQGVLDQIAEQHVFEVSGA